MLKFRSWNFFRSQLIDDSYSTDDLECNYLSLTLNLF